MQRLMKKRHPRPRKPLPNWQASTIYEYVLRTRFNVCYVQRSICSYFVWRAFAQDLHNEGLAKKMLNCTYNVLTAHATKVLKLLKTDVQFAETNYIECANKYRTSSNGGHDRLLSILYIRAACTRKMLNRLKLFL